MDILYVRSSDPFYIVSYYKKWVTTSWTYSSITKEGLYGPPISENIVPDPAIHGPDKAVTVAKAKPLPESDKVPVLSILFAAADEPGLLFLDSDAHGPDQAD